MIAVSENGAAHSVERRSSDGVSDFTGCGLDSDFTGSSLELSTWGVSTRALTSARDSIEPV